MTSTAKLSSSAAIREQLEEILTSPFFRTSKRCSSMLRYIVEQFVLNPAASLKERTIGVAVFARTPDYDTSIDPVVRATAGEIRKRLAQYYAQDAGAAIHITLPSGSYFPSIRMGAQGEAAGASAVPLLTSMNVRSAMRKPSSRFLNGRAMLALTLALAGALGLWWFLRPAPLEGFWDPTLRAGKPPIICLGDTARLFTKSGDDSPAGTQPLTPGVDGNDHLALPDVVALTLIASFLAPRTGKAFARNSLSTSFADLQGQPAILIGGRTNQWTMRSMKWLRFQLEQGESVDNIGIRDTQNPSKILWSVDFKTPLKQITREYAIVARFTSPATNQPTVIVAGTGADGTIAGAQFLTNPFYLKELADRAPRGWEKRNIEVVLDTEMINGDTGPPQILQVHVW